MELFRFFVFCFFFCYVLYHCSNAQSWVVCIWCCRHVDLVVSQRNRAIECNVFDVLDINAKILTNRSKVICRDICWSKWCCFVTNRPISLKRMKYITFSFSHIIPSVKTNETIGWFFLFKIMFVRNKINIFDESFTMHR